MQKKQSITLSGSPSQEEWRISNTGRLLVNATRRFEERIMKIINAKGFPDIRISHISVPRNLDMSGNRITELARRAAMTKQSMSDLVNQCEKMGFVMRRPDSSDHRAQVIVFTPRGRQLIEVIGKAIVVAERELKSRIGEASFNVLRFALLQYLDSTAGGKKRRSKSK